MEKTTREKVAEYLERGMTVLEISRLLGISHTAVYSHIRKAGLPTPSERKEQAS